MFKKRSSQKGFTLIELLVVIAIIGILATLVLLQLGTARAKGRDTQRIAAVNQFRSAVEQYMDDVGAVPVFASWDLLCADLKTKGYLSSCPTLTGMSYGYDSATKKYQLAAELETRASALDADSDSAAAGYTGGINGATEAAAGASCAAVADCYYDQAN